MSLTKRFKNHVRRFRNYKSECTHDQLQWIVPSIGEFQWKFCGIIPIAVDPCSSLRYALCRRSSGSCFDVIGSAPWPLRDPSESLYCDSHKNDPCMIAAKFFFAATLGHLYVPEAPTAEALAEQLKVGKFEQAIVTLVNKSDYEIVFFIRVPWAPESAEMYNLAHKLWKSDIRWKLVDINGAHKCKFKCKFCDRCLVDD